jgi:peptidoglycan/xylan/chitin deacetylase (PgdA/CDA1 family)
MRVARRLIARALALLMPSTHDRSLRILTYHRVNEHHPGDRMTVHPLAFRRQMEHIAESGRPVLPLDGAVARLRGEGPPLPAGALCLTFDDGYRDNLEFAAPVLERFGFTATVLLVTGRMGTRTPIDRYDACCEHDSALSWDEARELHACGHSLGGHGRTHRELAPLDAVSVREEVFGCRDDLLRELGEAPTVFGYPRGSQDPAVRRTVAEAGFRAAVTVYPGANGPGSDSLLLRRTEVSGDDDHEDFRSKLEGVFDTWHRLWQRARAMGA